MKNFIITQFCTLFLTTGLMAQVPFEFQSGEPARAREINANFDALTRRLNAIVLDLSEHKQRFIGNAKLSLGDDLGDVKLALYDKSFDNMYGLGVTAGAFKLNVNNPQARFAFFDKVNGDEIFTVQGAGQVGIKVVRPRFNLHVNGTAGKPGGGTWSTASDARLKEIHHDFTIGLSAIKALNPVYFQYKEGNTLNLPTEKTHIGLVAQEVEQVIPDAVGEYDQGYLSLNSDPVIFALLNAVKELDSENDLLKKELANLKKEIEAIKNAIAEVSEE